MVIEARKGSWNGCENLVRWIWDLPGYVEQCYRLFFVGVFFGGGLAWEGGGISLCFSNENWCSASVVT